MAMMREVPASFGDRGYLPFFRDTEVGGRFEGAALA